MRMTVMMSISFQNRISVLSNDNACMQQNLQNRQMEEMRKEARQGLQQLQNIVEVLMQQA